MILQFPNYIPLCASLVEGSARSKCRAVVVVPARNEEVILARTLDSLRCQLNLDGEPLDHDSYEVLLLLNNCTDSSESVAATYLAAHPGFHLHAISIELPSDQAFVGTARRMLMDTAFSRLLSCGDRNWTTCGILSTDADSVVAPDWIANNIAALDAGADVVGGVIHLFPEDIEMLAAAHPAVLSAYYRDRDLQRLVAELESILNPDEADPWPRHLEHFGASLACSTRIYAKAGGLPPARALEDIAFVDALRKVEARIRHCPNTHIFTSARMDGRAEIGLSGQLRLWREESERGTPHIVDSAAWIHHRFTSMAALRQLHQLDTLSSVENYPQPWRSRLVDLALARLPFPIFLEQLNCDELIEAQFLPLRQPRRAEIREVIADLHRIVTQPDFGTNNYS